MTTLTTTPTYDAFTKWLTGGQPRNIDGKPISATSGERIATRKPVETKPVPSPARETSDDLRKRLERSRKLAERKPSTSGALERAARRARRERKPYSAEARQRASAAARIVQQASKNERMDVAREHITALPADATRPLVRQIANQFHIGRASATIVIYERFGKPPKYKDDILAHLRTLKERPTASAIAKRFGVSEVYANVFIVKVFSPSGIGPRPARVNTQTNLDGVSERVAFYVAVKALVTA